MKKPTVSIVIVNYNGEYFLEPCLKSVFNLNYPKTKLEIIVVDNGSTDGSIDLIKKQFPKVKIIENDVNNYCKANNLGIKESKSDYIAFLNNDTEVDKNWLIELIKIIEEDSKIGAVGSKILYPNGQISNVGHFGLPNFYWGEKGAFENADQFANIEERNSLCGVAVLYPKRIFGKVGCFDEDFIIYMEDVDMSYRVKQGGFKLVYVPDAIIKHYFHGSGGHELSRYFIERNRLLYLAKHHPQFLVSSLLGNGYFTVNNNIDYLGKIYQIIADVILKLFKHHSIQKTQNILNRLFEELGKISNYENEILKQKVKEFKSEVLKKTEGISVLQGDLKKLNNNIIQKDEEVLSIKDELNNKNDLIKKVKEDNADKDLQLQKKHCEINNLKDKLQRIRKKTEEYEQNITKLNEIVHAKNNDLSNLWHELNCIKNSEGYKFILRPLWNLIFTTRKFLKTFFLILILFLLIPIFLFLPVFFFIEEKAWALFSLKFKKNIPERKIIPYKTLKLSVVIPNYGNKRIINRCLKSLFKLEEFAKSEDNEVIVVDDCSANGSVDFIKINFPKVRVIENKKNMGFGFSCNRGIKAARNELILLLNNDVFVDKGFLKPLIRHFKDESVFSVTPKLYDWDKKTFKWGMNVGGFKQGYLRFFNEKDTAYGRKIYHTSPTLYSVGAAMLFRKRDFLWLGGFDSIYKPYSWEDIDLSYRAWKRGLKVLYEPKSIIYHKGKATIGKYKRELEIKNEITFTCKNFTDRSIIYKFLKYLPQVTYNGKTKFLRGFLWALRLLPITLLHRFKERCYIVSTDRKILDGINSIYSRFKSEQKKCINGNHKKNILIVSPVVPYPVNRGGQLKLYYSLKFLSKKFNILWVSFSEEVKSVATNEFLGKNCLDYILIPQDNLNNEDNFNSNFPGIVNKCYSLNMKESIRYMIEKYNVDLVQIEFSWLAYYISFMRRIPAVLVEHDPTPAFPLKSYMPFNNQKERADGAKKWRDFLGNYYPQFDKVVTFTEEDKKLVSSISPKINIEVIPIGLDLSDYSFSLKKNKKYDVIFVGHFLHYPNIDGIKYFCDEIFPRITKRIKDVTLYILGSYMPDEVVKLGKQSNIEIIGEVRNIQEYFSKAKVLVVPIRLGKGLKVKILEAMASGCAVVTTKEIAIDYYDFHIGTTCLLTNGSPEEFAESVIRLIQNDDFRNNIVSNARKLVDKVYNIKAVSQKTEQLYKKLIKYSSNGFNSPIVSVSPCFDDNEEQVSSIWAGWDIIMRCNYRCAYCFNNGHWDKLKYFLRGSDEWLEFWKRVYFRHGQVHINNVAGGEPFLYPNFTNLIKGVSRFHTIGVNTNLSCIPEKFIKEVDPKRVKLFPSFHPDFTSVSKFIDRLIYLKEYGWRNWTSIVAYPVFFDRLGEYKEQFKKNGLEVFIQPFIGIYEGEKYPKNYTKQQKGFLLQQARVPEYIDYQLNCISFRDKLCNAGKNYFRVNAKGEIYRCAFGPKLGNIQDEDISLFDKPQPCPKEFCVCPNEMVFLESQKKVRIKIHKDFLKDMDLSCDYVSK